MPQSKSRLILYYWRTQKGHLAVGLPYEMTGDRYVSFYHVNRNGSPVFKKIDYDRRQQHNYLGRVSPPNKIELNVDSEKARRFIELHHDLKSGKLRQFNLWASCMGLQNHAHNCTTYIFYLLKKSGVYDSLIEQYENKEWLSTNARKALILVLGALGQLLILYLVSGSEDYANLLYQAYQSTIIPNCHYLAETYGVQIKPPTITGPKEIIDILRTSPIQFFMFGLFVVSDWGINIGLPKAVQKSFQTIIDSTMLARIRGYLPVLPDYLQEWVPNRDYFQVSPFASATLTCTLITILSPYLLLNMPLSSTFFLFSTVKVIALCLIPKFIEFTTNQLSMSQAIVAFLRGGVATFPYYLARDNWTDFTTSLIRNVLYFVESYLLKSDTASLSEIKMEFFKTPKTVIQFMENLKVDDEIENGVSTTVVPNY